MPQQTDLSHLAGHKLVTAFMHGCHDIPVTHVPNPQEGLTRALVTRLQTRAIYKVQMILILVDTQSLLETRFRSRCAICIQGSLL